MYYERRLPHWQPENAQFFVTWRLHGTWPAFKLVADATSGKAFAAQDRALDALKTGPRWLELPEVAISVQETLLQGASDWKLYQLQAWSLMPNHVHVLLSPNQPLRKVLMNIKSATGRRANSDSRP